MVSVLKICYLYFVYRGRWELFEATGTSVRKGSNKLTVMATHSQPNWRSFNHILEFHKWQWIIHLLHPSRFLLLLFGVFSVCVCLIVVCFVVVLQFKHYLLCVHFALYFFLTEDSFRNEIYIITDSFLSLA